MGTSPAELAKTYQLPDKQAFSQSRQVVQDVDEMFGKNIVHNPIHRRLVCYALAEIHAKGTSTGPIIGRIQKTSKVKPNIHDMLWIGRQWKGIVKMLASVMGIHPPPTGVMCLVRHHQKWERASSEVREGALQILIANNDFSTHITNYTAISNAKIKGILGTGPRVLNSTAMREIWKKCRDMPASPHQQMRHYSAMPNREPLTAIAASADALSLQEPVSREQKILLILLAFLSDSEISLYMLCQAARTRKEWGTHGDVQSCATESIIGQILPDESTISSAIAALRDQSLLTLSTNGHYVVAQSTRAHILDALPSKYHFTWQQQAVYTACAAIPRKYFEPMDAAASEMMKPHIIHAFQSLRDDEGHKSFVAQNKTMLVSALIEASRFSGLKWKQQIVAAAKTIFGDSDDTYLKLLICQRELLVNRLAKQPDPEVELPAAEATVSRRTHAVVGAIKIQQALNSFQLEKLAQAIAVLNSWTPMSAPSVAEQIIVFRQNLLRGKVLRYQGLFSQSISSLTQSCEFAETNKQLCLDEDAGDLYSELGDALQGQGDFSESEKLLTTQRSRNHTATAETNILLSLAECFFAQKKFDETASICESLRDRAMSRLARLRLSITLAKLHHINYRGDPTNVESAFECWTEALKLINKFPPTSGTATCVIYSSLCDILRRQGHEDQLADLEQTSREELTKLQYLSAKAEAKTWIAGLESWQDYINNTAAGACVNK